MRSFQFDDIVAVSGLSLAQVEQFSAMGGFPVYGPGLNDRGHAFLAPDLFNFSLAASLIDFGFSTLAIRDLIAGLGHCELDAESRFPIEMFPGQRRERFGPNLFVVRVTADGPAATLVAPSELWAGVTAFGAGATLVIDATGLAERIATIVPRSADFSVPSRLAQPSTP